MDFTNHTQMAQHLSKYITDPSTIHAHCINSWGRSPSIQTIRGYQAQFQKRVKRVDEPRPSDALHYKPPIRRMVAPAQMPVVAEVKPSDGPISKRILKAVADTFRVEADDVAGLSRHKKHLRPRYMAIKLLRDVKWADGANRFSLPHIGMFLSNRDHSTVVNALKRFGEICEKDEEYRKAYERLKAELL